MTSLGGIRSLALSLTHLFIFNYSEITLKRSATVIPSRPSAASVMSVKDRVNIFGEKKDDEKAGVCAYIYIYIYMLYMLFRASEIRSAFPPHTVLTAPTCCSLQDRSEAAPRGNIAGRANSVRDRATLFTGDGVCTVRFFPSFLSLFSA